MTRHAWAPHADGRLLANRAGLCRPCTRLLRQLTTSISVRAAYAFGDWPPRSPLARVADGIRYQARPGTSPPLEPVWDGIGVYARSGRDDPRCRHCGLDQLGHDPANGEACDELALRAAWGDR